MNPMLQQANVSAAPASANKKPTIIGLENVDLKDAPKIDLRELEPDQGGYNFTYLGAIQFEGQWGPYYLVGVQDQNNNLFKFFSNKQITDMISQNKEPFDKIGNRFFVSCKMKPGTKYTLKNGEEREAKGYSYNLQLI